MNTDTSPLPATPPPPKPSGTALRSSAVLKIEKARTFLDSARHDLCNLEGPAKKPHYCDVYDKVGKFDDDLGKLAQQLREMPSPTGVFQI